MITHLKITDEPAQERLVLRMRLSSWHLLCLVFYAALSLREVLRVKLSPAFPQSERALLDELEAWRTHARA
jgi:hypothetical protein